MYDLRDIQRTLNIGSYWGLKPVIAFLKELGYEIPEGSSKFKLTKIQYLQIVDNFAPSIDTYSKPTRKHSHYIINAGDVIEIPNNPIIRNRICEDGCSESYIYVLVKCSDGKERSVSFFPNCLCKSIFVATNESRQKIKATGSAVDLYRTADSVEEGLALLKGKKIIISGDEVYTIKDHKTNEYKQSHIYKYDLLEEKAVKKMIIPTPEIKIVNTNSVECFLMPLTNHYYLQTPESYSITENQKRLAIEYAEYHNNQSENVSEQSDLFSSSEKDNTDIFEIKTYGSGCESLIIAQKDNLSFVIFDNNKNSSLEYLEQISIIPLPGIVEDVAVHYDEDGIFILSSELIIYNELGQYGVFDHNGRNILHFQNAHVSFVTSNCDSIFDCQYYYCVKKGILPPSIYYKDDLVILNAHSVIPYFDENIRYLVIRHHNGWQVYDMIPWLEKKSKKPIPLLESQLPIDGKEPYPFIISEKKLAIKCKKGNDKRFGFVGIPSGRLVIPCVYNDIIRGFEHGNAQVAIDNNGNYIIIDEKNTILSWGNYKDEEREIEEQRSYNSSVGDWSFADAELEDFKDNWDPN